MPAETIPATAVPPGPDLPTAQAAFARATDPADPSAAVIGWPGCRPGASPAPGDLVLRRGPDGRWRTLIVAGTEDGGPAGPRTVRALDPARPGDPVPVRLTGAGGLVAAEAMLLRVRPEGAAELLPPPRPTVRSGSRGPAVIHAQEMLNRVHANRLAAGLGPISECPLATDGIFGSRTRAATLSFQRVAFPDAPSEWDGVIGPRTWAALDRHALDRPPLPVPPVPVPPVPPRPRPPGILPVVGRPLDPARWGPILSPHLSPRARMRSGNAVRSIVDGPETFRLMVEDIRAATGPEDYVYLLGWDNFDDFPLVAGDPSSTFRALFTAADRRGVEVAVMLWDQPFLNWDAHIGATAIVRRVNALRHGRAIEDDLTTNNTLASRARLAAALAAARVNPLLIPVIIRLIEPDLARLGGSHHQKVLVVKRGALLVGYCGGLDMNPNRLVVVKPNTGQPQHDAHCRVEGPSAHDLLETFLSRWAHHPGSARFPALRGARTPVPRPVTRIGRHNASHGGTATVIVARTFNPTRRLPPRVVRERDIKPMLLAAIRNAARFIYCEDQYLIDLDTADALRAALPRLAHVTILIPGTPISDLPFAKEYRRDFVERATRGLPAPVAGRLGVFQMSGRSRPPPAFTDHTYLHAKTWVFDDELAVIGTANCNRRGYTFDSEVDAFIFDDPVAPGVLTALRGPREAEPSEVLPFGPSFAQNYRMDLWAHHLGVPRAGLGDGVASGALWRGAARPPTARVVEFDHRLPTATTRRARLEQRIMDIAADRLRDLIDPTV